MCPPVVVDFFFFGTERRGDVLFDFSLPFYWDFGELHRRGVWIKSLPSFP